MSRPSWDDYFLKIAFVVAERSTCCRRQVGAVLVKDKQILTTGYNGSPKGLRHCGEIGCLREQLKVPSGERHELCRAVHAETNALVQAAAHGVAAAGATIYSTDHPCSMCAKALINAGIERIVYCRGYPDPLSSEILMEASIRISSPTSSPSCGQDRSTS